MAGASDTSIRINEIIVPDGGWGWVIVFSSFMIHFLIDGITYSMGDVFLRPMMDNLNKSRGSVSAIFGILPAVTLATAPIATIFTNTYGCRPVAICGACLAAGGFLLSCCWANIWFYYITIGILGGIGFGLLYLPAIVSVGFYFEKKRAFAMGLAVCGSGLGTLVFPAIMPFIIHSPLWFDYEGALLLEAAFIFICVIFGALMIPLPQEPSEIRRLELKQKKKASEEISEKKEEQIEELIPKIQQRESKFNNKDDINPIVISRKDVMYQGSLHNIPLYNEDSDEYHRQMIITSDQANKINEKKTFCKKLSEQIDFNLLKNPVFTLLTISSILTSLGFYVPYSFANDLAADAKVVEHKRHLIIMSIGISSCFGRVILGYLADRSFVNRLVLYNTTLIIIGTATMFAPFCNSNVATHMIYASVFGFFSGGAVSLASIVTVDLVGVDKLSDALGVILLFAGIATVIGTPVAGIMRDLFSNFSRPYLWPYLLFGGLISSGGLILFFIPLLRKREEKKKPTTKHQLEMGVLSYSKQNLSSNERQQQT